jgi:hypothetical protein
MQQRNQAIQENMRNNGTPYYQPSSGKAAGVSAK